MANRYWVGGTGNWDTSNTTNWSDTSGGSGGASIPTAGDDVFFDALSGTGTTTVLGLTNACLNLNFTGFTGTFTGDAAVAGTSVSIAISGSLTLAAGMTMTYKGRMSFVATTSGHTITTNGKAVSFKTQLNGVGGGWSLQDTFSTAAGGNVYTNFIIEAGTFNTNNNSMYISWYISMGSGVKTINLGSSIVQTYNWIGSSTNTTFNAGTSTVQGSGSDVMAGFTSGGLTYYNVVIAAGVNSSASFYAGSSGSFTNLTFKSYSNQTTCTMIMYATPTVTGTFTATGNDPTTRLLVRGLNPGTAVGINAAAVSLSYVDFQDIIGQGAASWTGTSIGDALGNSNITFTAATTRYAVAATAWSQATTWSATSGGAAGASAPLPQDDVILDAASGAITVSANIPRMCKNLTTTGFTGTINPAVSNNNSLIEVYGNVAWSNTWTWNTTTFSLKLMGRGSHTITQVLGGNYFRDLQIHAVGGTYTLLSNFSTYTGSGGDTVILYHGTFDADVYNVGTSNFTTSGTGTKAIVMGTGTWTLSGSGTIWDASTTGTTVTCETSTLAIEPVSAVDQTFVGGNKIYNNLSFTEFTGATNNLIITGNNTFNTVSSVRTLAFTLKFTTGSTTTVANWTAAGKVGQVLTIDSTTTGTHVLTLNTSNIVNVDYMNIQHSVAQGGPWYAGWHSTNNQSVATAGSGWLFAGYFSIDQSINFARASSQYTYTNSSYGLTSWQAFTVEGWIKLDTLPSTGETYGLATIGWANIGAHLWYENAAGVRSLVFMRHAWSTNTTQIAYAINLEVGRWYHVAATKDGSNNAVLYLDGISVASGALGSATGSAQTVRSTIGVGWNNGAFAHNMNGNASLFRIWDSALSGATIAADECVIYGAAKAGMRAEYSLDNVYTDASGNAYTLTSNGSPTFESTFPNTCVVLMQQGSFVGFFF